MKTFIQILFVFLLTSSVYSQTWELLYPKPTGEDIRDVAILDNGFLIMVTDQGKIFRSTNEGTTWQFIFDNDSLSLTQLKCVTNETWYLFGYNGRIFKTTNGGASFFRLNNMFVGNAFFINADTGWASVNNSDVYKTIDGGITWDSVSHMGTGILIRDFYFKDEINGFIVARRPSGTSGNMIYRTTNGCSSWDTVSNHALLTRIMTQIQGFGDTLYVFAEGSIAKSTNGGNNWSYSGIDPQANFVSGKLIFTSANNGFVIGNISQDLRLYRTTNGGATWVIQNFPYSRKMIAGNLDAKGNKIFMGHKSGFYRYSINNGEEWTQNFVSNGLISKLKFLNKNTGYLISTEYYELFKTTDGGKSFFKPDNFLNGIGIRDVIHLSSQNIIMLKSDSLYSTSNAGISWSGSQLNLNPCPTSGSYRNFFFNQDSIGYLFSRLYCPNPVGSSTFFHKTTNHGISFDNINLPIPRVLNVQFSDNQTIYTTAGFSIFKSNDSGHSWLQISDGLPASNIVKYFVFNDNEIWAMNSHRLFKSQNYINWDIVINNTPTETNFFVKDQAEIFVVKKVNEKGVIYHTTDKGQTWKSEDFPYHYRFYWNYFYEQNYNFDPNAGIIFTDDNVGFLYSEDIILTNIADTTSINQISEIIPSDFFLHQNYPNPFNPVTKIKFDVPSNLKNTYVTLSVYNILGQQVAELVNSQLSPGKYEYTFDARGLSSGVYYYRLKAGDLVHSKKMVLTK